MSAQKLPTDLPALMTHCPACRTRIEGVLAQADSDGETVKLTGLIAEPCGHALPFEQIVAGTPVSAPQSPQAPGDTHPGPDGAHDGAQRADGAAGIDLRAATEAAAHYLASGNPPSRTELAIARGTIAAAAPEVLRAAAEKHLARDIHEDLCSYGPPGTCDCALGETYRWLRVLAEEIGGGR